MEMMDEMSGAKDLSGRRFGWLVALEPTEKRSNKHIVWRCLCDCGQETLVRGSHLSGGQTKSCGCLPRERMRQLNKKLPRGVERANAKDLTGQRFGRLVAISPTEERIGGRIIWLCQCDCGIEAKASSHNLLAGQTRSCGCLRKECMSKLGQANRIPFGKAMMHVLLGRYQRQAERRELAWDLTEEDFKKLTGSDCHYCGIGPRQIWASSDAHGEYIYNGLDRINNNKGYMLGNVVPCCWECNQSKHTKTLVEFSEWSRRFAGYRWWEKKKRQGDAD